jgi:hypothetical protein
MPLHTARILALSLTSLLAGGLQAAELIQRPNAIPGQYIVVLQDETPDEVRGLSGERKAILLGIQQIPTYIVSQVGDQAFVAGNAAIDQDNCLDAHRISPSIFMFFYRIACVDKPRPK